MQPFWLSLIGDNDRIPDQLQLFLEAHGPNRDLLLWDTLKAYLRGALKSTIAYIKRSFRQEEEKLPREYQTAEAKFLVSPTSVNYIHWVQASHPYSAQLSASAKCKAFHAQQKNFEYGNQFSHLLAQMARQQISSSVVTQILRSESTEAHNAGDILMCFYKLYTNMYNSTLTYTSNDINEYLKDLHFRT